MIEVVVAFVILGFAFTAAFEVFSTGIRNVDVSGDYVTALLHAESKMATVGVLVPIEEGTTEGRFDDAYRWQLRIREAEPTGDTDAAGTTVAAGRPVLARLALDVYWGAEPQRSVRLDSFRLIDRARR